MSALDNRTSERESPVGSGASSLALLFVLLAGAILFLGLQSPPPLYTGCFTPEIPRYHGDTLEGLGWATAGIVAACYLLVSAFGYFLVRPFLRRAGLCRPLGVLASFGVGYVASLPVIRIVTLLVPYGHAFWPVVAVLVLVALAAAWREARGPKEDVPSVTGERAWQAALFLLVAAILLAAGALHQMQYGIFFWSGHGVFHVPLLQWHAQHPAHIPIITEHHDEILFTSWLSEGTNWRVYPLILGWITVASLRVSLFAFLYGMFRQLGLGFGGALLAGLFLMFGTLSAVPTHYYLLFEYGNPLFCATTTRMAGIGLAALLVSELTVPAGPGRGRLSTAAWILIGLGASAMSPHIPVWIVALSAWALVFRWMQARAVAGEGAAAGIWRIPWETDALIVFWVVMASILLFALPFDRTWAHGVRLLATGVPCGLLLWSRWRGVAPGVRTSGWGGRLPGASAAFLLAGGVIVGLLLLGNVLARNPVAEAIMAGLGRIVGPIEYRSTMSSVMAATMESVQAPGAALPFLGDYRDLVRGPVHSHYLFGAQPFCSFYGVFLIMMLGSVGLFRGRREAIESSPVWRAWYEVNLWLVVGVLVLFFVRDFTSILMGYETSWNKTRLTEIPVYLVELVFLAAVVRFTSGFRRMAVMGVGVALMVLPFFGTGRHIQMASNGRLLNTMSGIDWKRFRELDGAARAGRIMSAADTLELSERCADMGMANELQALVDRMVRSESLDAAYLRRAAAVCYRARQPELAVLLLDRGTRNEPKNVNAWLDLAAAQSTLGRIPAAVQSAGTALELDRDKALRDIQSSPAFDASRAAVRGAYPEAFRGAPNDGGGR